MNRINILVYPDHFVNTQTLKKLLAFLNIDILEITMLECYFSVLVSANNVLFVLSKLN